MNIGAFLDGRRIRHEVETAIGLFEERGWLERPEEFHRTPGPLEPSSVKPDSVRGMPFEHLCFDSGYEPWDGEPGAAAVDVVRSEPDRARPSLSSPRAATTLAGVRARLPHGASPGGRRGVSCALATRAPRSQRRDPRAAVPRSAHAPGHARRRWLPVWGLRRHLARAGADALGPPAARRLAPGGARRAGDRRLRLVARRLHGRRAGLARRPPRLRRGRDPCRRLRGPAPLAHPADAPAGDRAARLSVGTHSRDAPASSRR